MINEHDKFLGCLCNMNQIDMLGSRNATDRAFSNFLGHPAPQEKKRTFVSNFRSSGFSYLSNFLGYPAHCKNVGLPDLP